MIVSHVKDLLGTRINNSEVKNALKKTLISPDEGWDGYVMRVFELDPDGYTPKHTHPWPHINYFLSGKGSLHLDGKDYEVEAGGFAYVPSEKMHQFKNIGDERFIFLCIVPEEGDK